MIIKRTSWYWPAEQERMLHIYLPGDYEQSDEHYPVMYFFDGHNLFYNEDATYGRSWGLKTFLDSWHKKMIIVGMECSHEGYARLGEYNPYNRRWGKMYMKGIGDQTFRWILQDIKPMIDREYRTYPFREATGVAGSSMGGVMSVYGVLKYNEYFSKGAAVSGGFFYNLSNYRKTLSECSLSPDTRLYMSWGEQEAGNAARNGDNAYDTREARAARKFSGELKTAGIDTQIYFQPQGRHCEEDWEKQVPLFMNYLWCDQRL